MLTRVLALPALVIGLALAEPAIAQQEQPAAEPRAWISPAEGATRTVIRLSAEGLPGLSDVLVLAGPDPEQLRPIGRTSSDARGGIHVQLQVPEEAERGEPYYFAVDPAGEVDPILAEPPFEVLVRERVAPGGA
jgi:hypothetical protein